MMDCSPNSSGFMNYHSLNVYIAGDVQNHKSKVTRVVHISDTRGADSCYLSQIPKGDILIHSGDFAGQPCDQEGIDQINSWRTEVTKLNRFFKSTQHRYKIFVPGCLDFRQEKRPCAAEIQKELTEAIYLEDNHCKVMGLSIYGVPWVVSDDLRHRNDYCPRVSEEKKYYRKFRKKEPKKSPTGFILPKINQLVEKYKSIPVNVDICVSHSPAWRHELSDVIFNHVKPTLHLSGHDFSSYGVMWRRGILFSNAALQLSYNFPLISRPRKSSLEPISNFPPSQSRSSRKNFLFKRIIFHNSIEKKHETLNDDLNSDSDKKTLTNSFNDGLNGKSINSNGYKRPARWKRKLCTKLMNAPTILTMDNHYHSNMSSVNPSPYLKWGTEPTLIGRILSRFCCLFLRRNDFKMTESNSLRKDEYSKYSNTQSSYISLEQTPTSLAAQECARKDRAETGFVIEPLFNDASSLALTTLSLYTKSNQQDSVSSRPRGPIVFDLYHEMNYQEEDVLPVYPKCTN